MALGFLNGFRKTVLFLGDTEDSRVAADNPLDVADRAGGPGESTAAVTPDDDVDLPDGACRALLVTAAGDVEFRAAGNTSGSVTVALEAGDILPIRVRRVLEDTTATVVAIY